MMVLDSNPNLGTLAAKWHITWKEEDFLSPRKPLDVLDFAMKLTTNIDTC